MLFVQVVTSSNFLSRTEEGKGSATEYIFSRLRGRFSMWVFFFRGFPKLRGWHWPHHWFALSAQAPFIHGRSTCASASPSRSTLSSSRQPMRSGSHRRALALKSEVNVSNHQPVILGFVILNSVPMIRQSRTNTCKEKQQA